MLSAMDAVKRKEQEGARATRPAVSDEVPKEIGSAGRLSGATLQMGRSHEATC